MNRKEFLSSLGLGAAFVLTATCLNSCTSESAGEAAANLTIDLGDPANAALKTNGNFIVREGIVVARTINGDYVAATVTCSHEGNKAVTYNKGSNEFFCTVHGARFDLAGKGLNENGRRGLRIYQTALEGNTLRIFS